MRPACLIIFLEARLSAQPNAFKISKPYHPAGLNPIQNTASTTIQQAPVLSKAPRAPPSGRPAFISIQCQQDAQHFAIHFRIHSGCMPGHTHIPQHGSSPSISNKSQQTTQASFGQFGSTGSTTIDLLIEEIWHRKLNATGSACVHTLCAEPRTFPSSLHNKYITTESWKSGLANEVLVGPPLTYLVCFCDLLHCDANRQAHIPINRMSAGWKTFQESLLEKGIHYDFMSGRTHILWHG